MRIASIIVLLFFFSCNSNKIPKDILPQAKMQKVMWHLMQADELALYKKSQDTSFKLIDSSKAWYQVAYKENGVDETSFKRSMQFYESHPDLLQVIIDSLQHKAQTASIPVIKDVK